MPPAAVLAPAAPTPTVQPTGEEDRAAAGQHERPHLGAVLRHLSLSILTANIIPSVLFYLCLVAGNLWLALTSALCWCYGAAAYRWSTKRRMSGLLLLTIIGLTGKTAFAFATGDAYFYFLQPALSDVVVAALFIGSLLTAQPIVSRLAGDFYPMEAELASRPQVQQLFWRLTLLWSTVIATKAALSLWLLNTMPVESYAAAKTIFAPALIITGAALTVALVVPAARREGLLHAPRLAPAAA